MRDVEIVNALLPFMAFVVLFICVGMIIAITVYKIYKGEI